jgi:hypothetical protein
MGGQQGPVWMCLILMMYSILNHSICDLLPSTYIYNTLCIASSVFVFILTINKDRSLNDLKLIFQRLKTTDVPLQAVDFVGGFPFV